MTTIARLFLGRPRPLLITGLAPLVPILIGSAVNIWYTAIGDAVNVASRVEGLTSALGEPLLVTAATCAALRKPLAVEALGSHPVKGQPEPVVVFRPPPVSRLAHAGARP